MDASANGGNPSTGGAAFLYAWCVATTSDNCCGVGKPIQPASGTKVLVETDYRAAVGPLAFTRYYNSFAPSGSMVILPSLFGEYWRSNYDRSVYPISGQAPAVMMAVRPDSRVKYFDANGNELTHFSGTAAGKLVTAVGGGWTYTTANDEVETYDSTGRLTGIWDKTNLQQTLSYDSHGRLSQVADAHGRTLQFSYTGDIQGALNGTVTMTSPDGQTITYTAVPRGGLSTVAFPGGVTRTYLHEKGNWLYAITGIVDENGTRYETIDYDDSGRALDSYLAPGVAGNSIERNSFVYNSDGTTTHTEPLGQTQVLGFVNVGGVLDLASLSAPCSNCGSGTIKQRYYDSAGYPQSTIDFNGTTTTYTYDDSRGLELQHVEASSKPSQRTTVTSWNASFRLPDQRSVVNASSVTETLTKWTYNARGQTTARCVIDPAVSGASSYSCGPASNAPTGVRQWKYAYCDAVGTGCPLIGLLLSVDGPRTDVSDVTTYAYYPTTVLNGCATLGGACHNLGDLQTVTNALGQSTTYVSYDKNGRVTRLQDANGTYTDMTYHARGWLLTRTVRANADGTANSSLDATTTFAYDNAGNVSQVTQPDGSYLHYVYDNAHRLTDIYDSATPANYLQGNHIHYTLDAAGNRTDEQTKDTSGTLKRELSRTYDQLNRLTAILNASTAPVQTYTNPAEAPPSGITYTDGYDGNGNAIYSIDGTANHVGTEQQYDPLNRLIKTLQDHTVGSPTATHDTTTQYAYDTRDNLRSVTDPDNLTTNYTYDGLNNLTALSSPDTGSTGYTYDAAGNRLSQTDARGVTSTYSYDALNRLIGISYPTTSLNVVYAYDQANSSTGCPASYPLGRLTTITDSSGSTVYCYDRRGNVLSKAQTAGSVISTLAYGYTLADRLNTITYPSSVIVTYARDTVGRISGISYKANATATAQTVVGTASYLPFGPLNQIVFGNGRTLTKTYDSDYAIDEVVSSSADGLIVDASVDVLGNVISASDTVGSAQPTQQYAYDRLYRLTSVNDGNGNPLESFSYGPSGDRLSKTSADTTSAYAYVPLSHRLDSVDGVQRTYDANGNSLTTPEGEITIGGGISYGYADSNRLAQATTQSCFGRICAEGGNYYVYNGRGERVGNSHIDPMSGTHDSEVAYTYDEGGHLLGSISSVVQNEPTQSVIEYVYLDTIPVATIQDGTLYYIETDHLGTSREVIQPGIATANDTVVWKWDYFADDSVFGENAPSVQTITFNLRFPGQYFDTETGLVYNGYRDYEPATGRYIESDPIGLKGGLVTYSYVMQNPLRLVDPTGEAAISIPAVPPSIWPAILDLCPAAGSTLGIAVGIAIPNSTANSCADEPNPPPEDNCDQDKPCDPPEGTQCYEGPDFGKPHGGLSPHYHIYEMQKKRSKKGECFWRYLGGKIGVGVFATPPAGMMPCSAYPNFTGRGG